VLNKFTPDQFVFHTQLTTPTSSGICKDFSLRIFRVAPAKGSGNDADTTAAICGQLAGAYYGEEAIPLNWRLRLTEYNLIVQLAERLLRTGSNT